MNSDLLEMLNHDLASRIRNLEVARGLLEGADADPALAAVLLAGSIEELKEDRRRLGIENKEQKPSGSAQTKSGEL
jgi:hypothetical protein